MIIETLGVDSALACVALHIRRNGRTVNVTTDAFLVGWADGVLQCLTPTHKTPWGLPGFSAAVQAARSREKVKLDQMRRQKAWQHVEEQQEALRRLQADLQATQSVLDRVRSGEVRLPALLGSAVTVCWNCFEELYQYDYRCPSCHWRVCPECGACSKTSSRPDCNQSHPESLIFSGLRRLGTLDGVVASLEADLVNLAAAAQRQAERMEAVERAFKIEFPK